MYYAVDIRNMRGQKAEFIKPELGEFSSAAVRGLLAAQLHETERALEGFYDATDEQVVAANSR